LIIVLTGVPGAESTVLIAKIAIMRMAGINLICFMSLTPSGDCFHQLRRYFHRLFCTYLRLISFVSSRPSLLHIQEALHLPEKRVHSLARIANSAIFALALIGFAVIAFHGA
jgi:hypothetical protein